MRQVSLREFRTRGAKASLRESWRLAREVGVDTLTDEQMGEEIQLARRTIRNTPTP